MLAIALRLHLLGMSLIPLKRGEKSPDIRVLPLGPDGKPTWECYQTERASEQTINQWFGSDELRNVGIVVGKVSGFVAVDTDTPEAEALVARHFPPTPMMTRTGRGFHRYYRTPTAERAEIPIPATIRIGQEAIEIKRDGQYLVAPGSVHPSGAVYEELEPWPSDPLLVPEYPTLLKPQADAAKTKVVPLAEIVGEGSRNKDLFTEGCRLRRVGYGEVEILAALTTLNVNRCNPPLDIKEVETIARSAARYEPSPDAYPLTEAGDAEFFVAGYSGVVCFDHRRGRWILYREHHWKPQADGEIHRLALESARTRQAAALKLTDDDAKRAAHLKWALAGESRKRLSNLLAIAQNIKPVADTGDDWDTDPWLLGVPNGTVDLRTGRRRDGSPDDRITMNTNVPFEPAATCPLWDQTVAEIFDHDPVLIAYFDRWCGYSLTGDCSEEALAFCWGDGANGKGTLMNTMSWVLGEYADNLPFSALELHERTSIPNDIAKIVGKRFVTSSETGETQRLNEARIKALTGRDPITARFMHRDWFTFQPVSKFWLATNYKPEVRDSSEGFWRRIQLIPFTQSFAASPNLRLKDDLRGEGAGILARAVRGCLAWQREGLNPPDVVRAATESYRHDSLPLTRFIEECCVIRDGARATNGQLWEAYERWVGKSRERMTRRAFSDSLRQRFQTDPTNKRNVTFVGVGLIDDEVSRCSL